MKQITPKIELRNPLKRPLRIYFAPRDNKGCGFYRILQPASVIKDKGLAEVQVYPGWDPKLVDWCDIIHIQRPSDPELYESLAEAQAKGKIIIFELDDLIYGVHPKNPAYPYWSPDSWRTAVAIRTMTMCDYITVTTKRLANEYAQYNRNIFVLPNYIDNNLWDVPFSWKSEQWDNYYKKKNDDTIRIGWAGGGSHTDDLEMISDVLTKIAKKHKNVRIVLMGFTPQHIFGKIPLAESTCAHCGKQGQLELVEGTDLIRYPSKLKSLALDIGIAPLVENSFNECKSDIKLKEYAALGIPVVASDMKPYSESLKHGETGFLAKSGKEWFDYLELLIQNKSMREQFGKANNLWYKDNTIDKNIYQWMNVYYQVAERKNKW